MIKRHYKLIIFILIIFVVFLIYKTNHINYYSYTVLGDGYALGINSYGIEDYGYSDFLKDQIKKEEKLKTYTKTFSRSDISINRLYESIITDEKKSINNIKKNIKQVLRESDLVTLSIGLNDIIYKISITPDITDKKVNTIVDNVTLELNQLIVEINKYYPKKVYLIGYPDIPMENIYIKKGKKRLNRNMKEISNTVYINTEECIHHEDFLKSKSFYPSKYGYYKIYQELRKKLAK